MDGYLVRVTSPKVSICEVEVELAGRTDVFSFQCGPHEAASYMPLVGQRVRVVFERDRKRARIEAV